MRTEDDIRTALRTLADDAPDADAILSALRLTAQPGRGSRCTGRRGRLVRLVAPVMAAASVLAIVATSIAIGSGGRPVPPKLSAAAATTSGVAPYYVDILAGTTIRDTRSGAQLARLHPPTGYQFSQAAPGTNDKSWVLVASLVKSPFPPPQRLYALRFNPRNHRTKLTRLPIPPIHYLDGLAMSPNGRDIAVAIASPAESEIMIYTVSGSLISQWWHPGWICPAFEGLPCLSWAPNGTLAFNWFTGAPPLVGAPRIRDIPGLDGIRVLNSTAPSGSLTGESRLIMQMKSGLTDFVLSGDGTTITADIMIRGPRKPPGSPVPGPLVNVYEQVSAATGKLMRQWWPSAQGDTGAVYWSNQSGSKLIVEAPTPRTSKHARWVLGILSDGKFTPLPNNRPGLNFAF